MPSFQSKEWKRLTLLGEKSIESAVLLLEETGAQIVLVVDKERRLVGTLTDGDIRRGLLAGVTISAEVAEIMNKNPVTATLTATHSQILEMMHSAGARQIPVIDQNRKITNLFLWNEITTVPPISNGMVIMAGGLGTRLRPQTFEVPKPMLLVGGKPILQHIIERAARQGVSNFFISVNHLKEVIKDYFKDGKWLGVNISYLEEESPLGTAGALALLSPVPSEPFIVINGDVLTEVNYAEILDFHVKNRAVATMGVKPFEWKHPYGVVKTNGTAIEQYEEKPIYRSLINAGIYILSPKVISFVNPSEPLDMPSLFGRLSDAGITQSAYLIHENWIDVGQKADLDNANRLIREES